jgi:hypothetical protein
VVCCGLGSHPGWRRRTGYRLVRVHQGQSQPFWKAWCSGPGFGELSKGGGSGLYFEEARKWEEGAGRAVAGILVRVLEQSDQRCDGLFAAGLPGKAAEGAGRAGADMPARVLEQVDQRSDGLLAAGLPGKAAEAAGRVVADKRVRVLEQGDQQSEGLFAVGLPGKAPRARALAALLRTFDSGSVSRWTSGATA